MNSTIDFSQIPINYIKIPKDVILAKSLPEHRISVFSYLCFNQTWEQKAHYSPAYMIEWCGYRPNWNRSNKNNIYEKFKCCMQWYFDNNYLVSFKKDEFIQNNFQSSKVNTQKIRPERDYGLIYDFEFKKIIEYKSSYKPLNSSLLLLLLAYIRAYTWIRFTSISGYTSKTKKNKPEIFYSQYKTIGEFIGVSERLVSKATDVLIELGFVTTYRLPCYLNQDGEWRTNDIIYVCPYKIIRNKESLVYLKDYDWKKELENGIQFLQSKKREEKKFFQE